MIKNSSKIKNILNWVALLLFVVLSVGFVSERKNKVPCNYLVINIIDSLDNLFVSKDDIRYFFYDDKQKVLGYSLNKINTKDLEDIVMDYPPVKDVSVYYKMNGTLNVDIYQRKPILRIISRTGKSFYIDSEGTFMPLSNRYSSHVLIANGNIDVGYNAKNDLSVYQLDDTLHKGSKMMKGIYELSKTIYDDTFWRSQFLQIYVNAEREIELIPRVGGQIILLGGTENHKEKLRKLKALYLKGFKYTGWNQYETINLKYSNQVVCTRK